MNRLRLPALLLGALFAGATLSAEVLQDWTFDDRGQVPLSKVANAVRGGASWTVDFDASTTNGRGQFVIKRPTGGPSNSYAQIQPLAGSNAVPHWLVVRVLGWSFAGTNKNEVFRLGFTTNNPESRPNAVVILRISNNESGRVSVGVEALGDGAVAIEPVEAFSNRHNVPMIFAVKFDPGSHTFSLHISADDGATWQKAGEGRSSPSRTARFLRFGLSGGFNLREDIFILDRITLQTHAPNGLE